MHLILADISSWLDKLAPENPLLVQRAITSLVFVTAV